MRCTGEEWDHCRVEKMGCNGCYYNNEIINIGDYIRNKGGYIDKVKKIIGPDEKMEDTYYCCESTMASSYEKEIVKHSKDIKKVIEEGDIVKYLINSKQEKAGIVRWCKNSNNKDYLGIEGWGLDQIKILKVLTHEQFEDNCYENGGE